MRRGCGEKQASHHSWPEGVSAGAQKELQQAEREPQAHDRAENSRSLQADIQSWKPKERLLPQIQFQEMWNPVVTRQLRKTVDSHRDWGSATPEKDSPVLKPLDIGHSGQTHAPWPDSSLEDLGSKWPHGVFCPFGGREGTPGWLIRMPMYLLKVSFSTALNKIRHRHVSCWVVSYYLAVISYYLSLGAPLAHIRIYRINPNCPREKWRSPPAYAKWTSFIPSLWERSVSGQGANHVQQTCEGLKDLRIMVVGNLGTG